MDSKETNAKIVKMNLGASIRLNKFGIALIGGMIFFIVLLYRNSGSPSQSDFDGRAATVSLKRLLSAAIDAAERGGKIVISEEHDKSNVDASTVSPAATFNVEVESTIVDDDSIPAEDIRVWIDPLDATQEYTENLKQYVTTMVCVAVKGYPTLGVIHKPFENLTAWGWAGKGVSPKLHVTKDQGGPKDDIAHIIVSRSHSGDVKDVALKAFGESTVVIPAGGAGYKTLAVIQGEADAYVHVTLIKKWDLCAGNAILNALGGKMTTLKGTPIDYGNREEYKNQGGVLATLYQHDYYLPKLQVLQKS
ncbi:putative inositol monophosphatase 3 isoform X3 [Macrobrachium nipponense]|uniref:putative inositol monophosphatase 3 isoform X3 n=1 Tax=Macrobrachium nipponense TaxID=159736 RepID=UPI0030C82DE9